jgi:hypothetical protein
MTAMGVYHRHHLSSLRQCSIAYVLLSGGGLFSGGQTIPTGLIACRAYLVY